MTLDVLDSTWTHVWKEHPQPAGWAHGLIIRAANGNGTKAPEGFDFADNYRRWRGEFTGPMLAWTFLYASSDPSQAAHALAQTDAPAYLIDWEDVDGQTASGANLARMVDVLRQLRPGRPVGFTSYPTANQARAHGVAWATGIQVVDWEAPQVYFAGQAKQYDQVLKDAGKAYVQLALAPADWSGWAGLARKHLQSGRGVGFWRLDTLTAQVRATIRDLTQEYEEMPLSEADKATIGQIVRSELANAFGKRWDDKPALTATELLGKYGGGIVGLAGTVGRHTAMLGEIKAALDALEIPPPVPGPGVPVQGTWTTTPPAEPGQ